MPSYLLDALAKPQNKRKQQSNSYDDNFSMEETEHPLYYAPAPPTQPGAVSSTANDNWSIYVPDHTLLYTPATQQGSPRQPAAQSSPSQPAAGTSGGFSSTPFGQLIGYPSQPAAGTSGTAQASTSGTAQSGPYQSTVDAYGNVYVPGTGITYTPADIYDWANQTGDPYAIAVAIQQYGVNPAHIVDAYNLEARRRGKPTVTYQAASEYLGMPIDASTGNKNVHTGGPYQSKVDAYGNVYVPATGVTYTPADIYNWIEQTGDPYAIAAAIQQYGVDPVHIVDAYNLEAKRRGKPTVTYEEASRYLGIPIYPHGSPSSSSSWKNASGTIYYEDTSNAPSPIDIPKDVYPYSTSKSTSTQSSKSYTGMNWEGPVASDALSKIKSQIGAISQLPGTVGQQAANVASEYAAQQNAMASDLISRIAQAYATGSASLQQALQSSQQGVQQAYRVADELERAARYSARQAAQGNYGLNSVLQQLNATGMLNSAQGANVMSQTLGNVLSALSQQAYQAQAQGAQTIQDALRAMAQTASQVGAAYAPLAQTLTSGYGTAGTMREDAAKKQLQAQEFMANLVGALIPQALSTLASLDKIATSESSMTSSSESYSADPLAPYRLLVDMLNLMS